MAYTTIDNPELYFQTKIYTGNGANNRAITFDGDENMQPDWLWIKNRSEAQSHALFDSVRGATKRYGTNSTGAESTENTNLDSFDTNGFTVDNELIVNGSSDLMVAWAWKAGGSASSNSNGSITSSVSAGSTQGFSIVSYSGNGSAGATVAHSLAVTPNVIIIKNRGSNERGWIVYHDKSHGTPQENFTLLNTTAAVADLNRMQDTAPTSTVFSLSDDTHVNNGSDTYIAYCFAEKKGFSKFGTYSATGATTDATFIYTGFKPSLVIIKKINASDNWQIFDNKRDTNNPVKNLLYPNLNDDERALSTGFLDLVSNGFKIRTTDAGVGGGDTYIYLAFAESPFVNSKGVPTNAR